MKTILCFGDSNTWGQKPGTAKRFGRRVRWTGVLRRAMGRHYEVIEEGRPGRTTAYENPEAEGMSGREYIVPCLESHRPLDLVIILLGTNDIFYNVSAEEIAQSAADLVSISQDYAPHVLLVTPPPPIQTPSIPDEVMEKARRLAEAYGRVAEARNCAYLDAGTITHSSAVDGTHLDADQHQELGKAIAAVGRSLLEDGGAGAEAPAR